MGQVAQALDSDPDLILTEIANVRLDYAQQQARSLTSMKPGERMRTVRKWRASDDADARLAVALYQADQQRKRTG